ncbi:MAG: hypothetical protein R3F50_07775 [Gammaproteobacteria bacterium]|jgi:Ca2+-binding EF-hand superfamily protein
MKFYSRCARVSYFMAAGFILLATPLESKAQSQGSRSSILSADSNGDGEITWSEVIEMRTNAFARLDRNGDGFVDKQDRPGFGFGRRFDEAFNRMKARYDVDADQRISRSELLEGPEPMFEAGDKNNDEVLSSEEMAALRAGMSNTNRLDSLAN